MNYKVTSSELKVACLSYFRFKKQCVCVDEFNGADVIVDTGKEIIEIEVKVNKYDLMQGERRKVQKHKCYLHGKQYAQCHPNKFMFCVPSELKNAALDMVAELNPKYGILVFDTQAYQWAMAGGHTPCLVNYLSNAKRARSLHEQYEKRQQQLIAKRCSSKIVGLLETQHRKNIDDYRSAHSKRQV